MASAFAVAAVAATTATVNMKQRIGVSSLLNKIVPETKRR
jgi:hypothetical protein